MKDMMVKGKKVRLTYINQTPKHTKINPFRPNQTSVKSPNHSGPNHTQMTHTQTVDHKTIFTNRTKPHHTKLTAIQPDLNKISPIIQDQITPKSYQKTSFTSKKYTNHMKPHQTTPNQTHPNITRTWMVFGVICTFLVIIDFLCDLDMICSEMIWCDFIEVWFGRCQFVLVWFDMV